MVELERGQPRRVHTDRVPEHDHVHHEAERADLVEFPDDDKRVAVAQRVPAEVTNWLPSTRNLTKLERSLLSCYPEKSGPTQ